MKLLVNWKMREGKLHEALAVFSQMTAEQDQAQMGDGIELIGRWHDLSRGTGTAIFEVEDQSAFTKTALMWNPFMEFELSLVTDDEETREIGRQIGS